MHVQELAITGGAGFVGSNLALAFRRRFPEATVVAFDNLRRRGSELALARLQAEGVRFVHGDVRRPEDLETLPPFELLLHCAAESSVLAGTDGNPTGVLQTNLQGTLHCLEAARRRGAAFLYLSTSRVYPISALNALPFQEGPTRYSWQPADGVPGFSPEGIAEDFSLDGPRSFYGASKLAGELLVREYVHNCGLKALINRCGLLTGPWQMGKVDQGVVTLWAARHFFGRPLQYTGFGGSGKQVRDVLHVEDLFDLLCLQLAELPRWGGEVYNVGGGPAQATSLRELTDLCVEETGRRVDVGAVPETHAVDLRIYVTDARKVQSRFNWRPRCDLRTVVGDIHRWLREYQDQLRPILG